DGYFGTGDLARWDGRGGLILVDRMHDTIITGGGNVYPAEGERALMEHPRGSAPPSVGGSHPEWGEGGCSPLAPRLPPRRARASRRPTSRSGSAAAPGQISPRAPAASPSGAPRAHGSSHEAVDEPARQRAAGHEPRRADAKCQQQHGARRGQPQRPYVDDRGAAELHADDGHERQRGGVDAVEERPGRGRAADARDERAGQRHKDERGQEYARRRDDRAGRTAEKVADERGRRRERPGRYLPHGDCIEELRLGEPAPALDEVGAEEREEQISAAVE